MITWKKKGLTFKTEDYKSSWINNSALTPTPFRLNNDVIRIYAGFRDALGISRIGYVDVNAHNPKEILAVSKNPVIELGRDGCFDDNGMILGDVISRPDGIYMFYVGFQLVAKAKFLAFSGLAISKDLGQSFHRISEAPILERAKGQTTIAAIHSVRYENDKWRIWYASGDDWEIINDKPYPKYNIHYVETNNLLEIPKASTLCVDVQNDEYRIGRPRVYLIDGRYFMYYTKGSLGGDYFPGVAYSEDGITWGRSDNELGIHLSAEGWDSLTLCYPALINHNGGVYMFYNGNNMGVDGFGYAHVSGLTCA